MATATRIEQGYRFADSAIGGYCSELWEVSGIDAFDAIGSDAVAAGLPDRFAPHPKNPALIVRERIIDQVIDNRTTFVRVEYRPASYDVGTVYGVQDNPSVAVPLRLIWTRDNTPGANGWKLRGDPDREPALTVTLWKTYRTITTYTGGDIDSTTEAIVHNKGNAYILGSAPYDRLYVLAGGYTRKMKDGRVVADYSFYTHNGFKAIPAGTYQGQDVAIPELLPMASISTYQEGTNTPTFSTKTILQITKMGMPLPGIA